MALDAADFSEHFDTKFSKFIFSTVGRLWLSTPQLVGCVAQLVERQSLTGKLSLSCARPAADG